MNEIVTYRLSAQVGKETHTQAYPGYPTLAEAIDAFGKFVKYAESKGLKFMNMQVQIERRTMKPEATQQA